MRIISALGSQRQLAKRFRVSLTFIENLLKRYRTDGTVEARAHGGGQVAKLSPEQETVLVTLVEEDNDAILVELCDRLQQRVGVRVSRATMGRIVQKLKLTRKKTLHATEQDSERVQQLRVEYWHEIGEVNLADLVFVDETGSNAGNGTTLCPFSSRQPGLWRCSLSTWQQFDFNWSDGAKGTHWRNDLTWSHRWTGF